ncbi:hypothetical protein QQ045_013981 [Rhodiola kirilowii]
MRATDYQRSPGRFNTFSRSLLSMKREQVHSMSGSENEEVELFQKHVTERFLELSSAGSDELLSISWIRKLLDVFLCCQEEFRMLLFNNKSQLSKSPLDWFVTDFFERVVKALDVCNAIRDGVEQIKQWQKLIEIVLVALDVQKSLGEGQFRRAKKVLIDLAIGMLGEKEAHRSRSFGRNNVDKSRSSLGYSRSLSWSVSRSWSAAKQLQAIGSNLVPPRGGDIAASNGLVVAAYTMSSVLLFTMWTLVAAIPCQDRGLQVHFSIPRHFSWAGPILLLHEQIFEESKKRDRKSACGLLREIHQIEKCRRLITELVDSVQFPLTEEKEAEVRNEVAELAQVNEALKSGLEPLESQVREVFHRIVRSRTEGLASVGRLDQ